MNMPEKKTCTSCRASLNATAQFCHACGAKQGAERKPLPPLVWGLIGLAVVLVVAVVSYNAGRTAASSQGPAAPFATGGASGQPPDISQLSPQEQADMLFNRVMTAHENGDVSQMNMFAPMALQAYASLGALDADAHYHVGLMSAITGNASQALARADSMEAKVPGHLLASMLRSSVALMQGDSATMREARRHFLQFYDKEMAARRQEYLDHQRGIEAFKSESEAVLGVTSRGP